MGVDAGLRGGGAVVSKIPRRPDWKVATPSQVDPDRWIDIGAGWNGQTDQGKHYINVQLDVMPNVGRLTLFPIQKKED